MIKESPENTENQEGKPDVTLSTTHYEHSQNFTTAKIVLFEHGVKRILETTWPAGGTPLFDRSNFKMVPVYNEGKPVFDSKGENKMRKEYAPPQIISDENMEAYYKQALNEGASYNAMASLLNTKAITTFVTLPDETRKMILRLLDKKINFDTALEFSKTTDEKQKIMRGLILHGMSEKDAKELAELPEEKRKEYVSSNN